jgi:hypothetical protein
VVSIGSCRCGGGGGGVEQAVFVGGTVFGTYLIVRSLAQTGRLIYRQRIPRRGRTTF